MDPEVRKYIAEVQELIRQHGRAVQGVGGDEETLAYMYTVGNTMSALPEFFSIGIMTGFVKSMFNIFSHHCLEKQKEGTLTDVSQVPMLFAEWWPTVVEEFSLNVKGEPARFAMVVARGWEQHAEQYPMSFQNYIPDAFLPQVRCVQLLWPDTSNKLPNEEGYDHAACPQPIFYAN